MDEYCCETLADWGFHSADCTFYLEQDEDGCDCNGSDCGYCMKRPRC